MGRALPRFADPEQFALGIGVPSQLAAWARREDGQPRHLASVPRLSEPAEDLALLGRVVAAAGKAGVHVHADLRASGLRGLFEGMEVVTLVAHAPGDREIELYDTAIPHARFVDAVPASFAGGCVDLVSCHSEPLAEALRFGRRCRVVGHSGAAHFKRSLMVYLAVLLAVVEHRLPYHRAMSDVLSRWMEGP